MKRSCDGSMMIHAIIEGSLGDGVFDLFDV